MGVSALTPLTNLTPPQEDVSYHPPTFLSLPHVHLTYLFYGSRGRHQRRHAELNGSQNRGATSHPHTLTPDSELSFCRWVTPGVNPYFCESIVVDL